MTSLIPVTEVRATLGLGRTLTFELIARGELPHVRIGRRVLVRRSDLEAFIEAHLEGGPQAPNRAAPGAVPGAARGRVRGGGRAPSTA